MKLKLWLDDIREAPEDYYWAHSVNEAIQYIRFAIAEDEEIELLDLDHDLGDFAIDGGDGIKLLDWCIENKIYPEVCLHTSNPVGRSNMIRLIERYWGT